MFRFKNNLKTAMLLGLLMGGFIAAGYFIGGQRGMIVALALGGVMNFFAYFYSDKLALAMMRAKPLDEREAPDIYRIVRDLSHKANLPMPRVYLAPTAAPNAFATGMSRNNALVAVSAGLLQNMDADEVEAVLGHEISHVSNGDMVTLGLIRGVVNTFVIFLSRVIGHVVDRVVFKTERGYGPAHYITSIVAQIFLSILASIIVMWFSRRREFRADAGGAALAGRGKMISALQALQRTHEPHDLPGEFAAFGISGGLGAGIKRLFMTHPPLEERIAALQSSAR